MAVAVGGALGTVTRYELALAEPVMSGRFPWATFGANIAGSLVLGIAVVVWANPRSKVYHASSSKSYGKTKRGAYMCEKEATSAGFHAPKPPKSKKA